MSDSNELKINIRYSRSPTIAEVPVDGVFGAISTAGQVMMAVYTERLGLPDSASVTISPDPNNPGEVKVSDVPNMPDAQERIIHSVLHFDLKMAKAIREWLDDKIGAFEGSEND